MTKTKEEIQWKNWETLWICITLISAVGVVYETKLIALTIISSLFTILSTLRYTKCQLISKISKEQETK